MDPERSELLVQTYHFTVHILVGDFSILGTLMRSNGITACHPPLLFFRAQDAEKPKGFLPSLEKQTKIPLENFRTPSVHAVS